MISIFEIWTLLEPKTEYANLFSHCKQLWESWTDDKQEEVFLKIEKKKLEHKFVDYNPLLALRNNANPPRPRSQEMSFRDYYARFGTTEEQGGWKMVRPEGGVVYYEKK